MSGESGWRPSAGHNQYLMSCAGDSLYVLPATPTLDCYLIISGYGIDAAVDVEAADHIIGGED